MDFDLDFDLDTLEFCKRLLVLLYSGYGAYKALRAITILPELVATISEFFGSISKDLKQLITSDSDQIPISLKQFSKLAGHELMLEHLTDFTDFITVPFMRAVIRAYQSWTEIQQANFVRFVSRILDRLFATAGTGFLSVIVGSFAKKLAIGYFPVSGSNSYSELTVASNNKFKKVIEHCIKVFLSSPVYTKDVNAYNDLFSVLTNPAHQDKVKDMLVSVCNRAVDTLVKTSHPVSTSSGLTSNMSPVSPCNALLMIGDDPFTEEASPKKMDGASSLESSQFVLDLSGRVTFETTRSAVEFLLWKLMDGLKISLDVVHDEVVCRGLEVIKYFIAKSSVIVTIFIALYLHVVGGTRLLFPAAT